MSKVNPDDTPMAFPYSPHPDIHQAPHADGGMRLWDYYAAAALSSAPAQPHEAAEHAAYVADLLILEREKRTKVTKRMSDD